jgi:hypothetical protein
MSKLIFLVVILGMMALCVGCQSGLSEAEIRGIARQEMAPVISEVLDLKTENANLEQRVEVLEGQLTLLQAMRAQDIEDCLGDIVSYIDDLYVYLNDVSAYFDNLYDYLRGFTSFLWMPPLLPPYWSFTSCPGY